jgi:hypothetical protein
MAGACVHEYLHGNCPYCRIEELRVACAAAARSARSMRSLVEAYDRSLVEARNERADALEQLEKAQAINAQLRRRVASLEAQVRSLLEAS